MQWQEIVNKLDGFFNKPLPIIGISLAVLLVFAWKIFMSTSYGKKKYNEIKTLFLNALKLLEDKEKAFNKKVEEIQESTNKKIEALEAYYETKLAQGQAKEDALESLLISVCDQIHNDKVKQLVLEYNSKSESYQTIMTDKINQTKQDVINEFENRIKLLEDKLYVKEAENNKAKEEIL